MYKRRGGRWHGHPNTPRDEEADDNERKLERGAEDKQDDCFEEKERC